MRLYRQVIWIAAGAAACGKLGEDRIERADTARVVEQAGRVMAARREAQPQLDSARTSYARREFDRAATQLRAAAAFARAEADSAIGDGRAALLQAGHDLDSLAARVARNAAGNVSAFDRTFARVHEAESRHHLARARDAWTRRDRERAGEELLMAVDHLERASKDAALPLDATARQAVTTVREVAMALDGNTVVAAAEAENAFSVTRRELDALAARMHPMK
jgi:hypothetical protein